MNNTLGAVVLDVAGQALTSEEREVLAHPQVGGLILFARNYDNPQQITDLIRQAREVKPYLLVAVDHEGGRVQRFKTGFTRIPSMLKLAQRAPQLISATAELMALELMAVGVDVTFAPVLDRFNPQSRVIGDRAFAECPKEIVLHASEFMGGLSRAGMAAIGKHFPGHGGVIGDTHVETAIDERDFAEIKATDLMPFSQLSDKLQGIMPAHVIFPAVCEQPVGYSSRWLLEVLRQQLQFNGVIFSDDLSMEAAKIAGDPLARGLAALNAGCTMVLLCNQPHEAIALIEGLESKNTPAPSAALMALSAYKRRQQMGFTWQALRQTSFWDKTYRQLNALNETQ